jgi:hypothetical protein
MNFLDKALSFLLVEIQPRLQTNSLVHVLRDSATPTPQGVFHLEPCLTIAKQTLWMWSARQHLHPQPKQTNFHEGAETHLSA